MITDINSEDRLVQQTFADHLRDRLGWESVYAYNAETFGPQRSFWGTDITRMPCSWKQCVTMFTEEMPWLKGRDLELVMGRALCDWIGWKLPG